MRLRIARASLLFALTTLAACASDPEPEPDGTTPLDAAIGAIAARDSSLTPVSSGDAAPGTALGDGGQASATLPAKDAGMDARVPQVSDAGRDTGTGSSTDAGTSTSTDSSAPIMSGNPSYPPINGGCQGWTTRYWDCCKPHCGWSANVSGGAPLATCSQSDQSLGGNYNATSSCDPGGTAFMCQALAPWMVNANLSYGFAAVLARGDICGKCYQLQFSGRSHDGDDPGSAALAGKTMIVQATNVGGDVGSGQFDLLIPGGGVGKYNACSSQWGVGTGELGAQYGGFLKTCKDQGARDHAAIKSCVMQRCTAVFGARGLSELEAGCRWFVDWFQAADNPALVYKEVACPQELKTRGMNRSAQGSNACGV